MSDAGDINGDGIGDIIVGAPANDDGGSTAGKAYVVYGQVGATRGTLDVATMTASEGFAIQGETNGDTVGFSVSQAGDVNGDGIGDVIVSAHKGDNGGSDSGEAYVIYGQAGATRGLLDLTNITASDGFIIEGPEIDAYAGFSVSGGGDVNGDGLADVIVGAPFGNDGGTRAGEA